MAVARTQKQRPRFEQFFAIRRFQPLLAFGRDGSTLLFSSNISGQFNLWRVPVEGGWPDQLTAFTDETVRAAAVSPRDGTIALIADHHGSEFHQVYALPESGGWPDQWTDEPQVQHLLGPDAWSPDGTKVAYAGNSRTPTDMEIWIRDVDSGDARPIFGEGMFAVPGAWSPDGSRLLAAEFRNNSDLSVHLLDVESGDARDLTPHEGEENEAKYFPGPWAADGSGFHMLTDAGREFVGLAFYRVDDESWEWLETPDADIDEVAGSHDGRVLAWLENDGGWAKLRLRDLSSGKDLPEPQLPPLVTPAFGAALTLSHDGSHAAAVLSGPRRPPEVWVVETATGRAWTVTESRIGGLREEDLGDVELVTFESFDGHEIPAWLYRPEGEGPHPAVLSIHGGPEAQERPWYQPLYQYLRSLGIAVLATNIRGSTGYGKSYQKLIQRDWGGGDLKDFEHAVEWLRAQDWVDDERIGVYGGSYGGFATLSCVTRLPDYWAAAVDIVGPSNLVTFARAVPPQWRRFMATWLGDPETEQEFLLERSPLTYVEDVRAPLLVIQGAKDPRVVKPESDQLVERLRELGRTVEYEVFEDEGHGFTKRENELRGYRLAADWFEKFLVENGA